MKHLLTPLNHCFWRRLMSLLIAGTLSQGFINNSLAAAEGEKERVRLVSIASRLPPISKYLFKEDGTIEPLTAEVTERLRGEVGSLLKEIERRINKELALTYPVPSHRLPVGFRQSQLPDGLLLEDLPKDLALEAPLTHPCFNDEGVIGIQALPPELIILCLSFLNTPKDLVRASEVCLAWKDLARDKKLWRQVPVPITSFEQMKKVFKNPHITFIKLKTHENEMIEEDVGGHLTIEAVRGRPEHIYSHIEILEIDDSAGPEQPLKGERIAAVFPNLSALMSLNAHYTKDGIEALGKLPNLTNLGMRTSGLKEDESFEESNFFTGLLAGGNGSDASEPLKCLSLESLLCWQGELNFFQAFSVSPNRLEEFNLNIIENFPDWIQGISDSVIRVISESHHLQRFSLCVDKGDDTFLERVFTALLGKKMRHIHIKVEEAEVPYFKVATALAEFLRTHRDSLRNLTLNGFSIPADSLRILNPALAESTLRLLDLSDTRWDSKESVVELATTLSRLPSLHTLDLGYSYLWNCLEDLGPSPPLSAQLEEVLNILEGSRLKVLRIKPHFRDKHSREILERLKRFRNGSCVVKY